MQVSNQVISIFAIANVLIWLMLGVLIWPDLMQGSYMRPIAGFFTGVVITALTSIGIFLGDECE